MLTEDPITSDIVEPPHDADAERAYLGSFIMCEDPKEQDRLRRLVWPAAFFDLDNRTIYATVCSMLDRGVAVDVVTLRAELAGRGLLAEVGGAAYLGEVLTAVPTSSNAEHYANVVRDKANRREGIELCRITARDLSGPGESTEVLRRGTEALWKIGQRKGRVDVYSLADIVGAFVDGKRERRAVSLLTGIESLDEYSGVFSFGKYTVVAGRPSMGKSTFMRWLLGEWAKAGTPVGLISVEEDRQKIAGNYLSASTGIENDYVAYKDFTRDDFEKADKAVAEMHDAPWHGCDTAFSLSEVVTAFDYLVQQKGCKVVGVDHLHLISPDRHSENEQREVKEISRRLKELGKYHGVVMVVAAQLKRPDAAKVPGPPTLTDLRASGAIEEHADAVILLHREDYYRKNEAPTNECELHIEKNRNGKRGVCVLKADLKHQRFEYTSGDPFMPRKVIQAPAAPQSFDPWTGNAL